MSIEDPIRGSARAAPWAWLFALLAFTALAWGSTLQHSDWTADDQEVVLAHPVVNGALPLTEAFCRDYTHHIGDSGQWRPLSTISLRVDHALYGRSSSTGWHLSNILLHLLAVALAAGLAYRSTGALMLIGVAVYAAHPLLSDSVAWVSGRPSLVCAVAGLAGGHLHLTAMRSNRGPLLLAISAALALSLPLMAKEDGLLFGLLLLALGAQASPRAASWTALGCAAATLLWLFARESALGAALPNVTHPALGQASLAARLPVGLSAAAEAIKLTLIPFGFPPRYELTGLPSPTQTAAVLAFFTLGLAALRQRLAVPTVFLALPLLAFLPFLQLLPAGEVFAPRFTHLPLLLGIPLTEHILSRLRKIWLALIAVALIVGAHLASDHYSSASSYWRAALAGAPQSPAVWNALGVAHADEGRHAEAIEALERALSYNERYSKAWSNLALSLRKQGEDEGDALHNAVSHGPNNTIAHINLGKYHMRAHADDEAHEKLSEAAQKAAAAKRLFLRATELSPGMSSAWRNLAASHRALGETDQAARAAARAEALTRG